MVKQTIIKSVYEDINNPACYSSINKLLAESRKINKSISKKDVLAFLKTSTAYTLHKQPRYKFKRLTIKPSGLYTDWQADLAVMDKLIASNDGYRYILVCIDCLSRKIFAEPVKTKTAKDMKEAFNKIFTVSKYRPWRIVTDSGLEFISNEMLKYFKDKDILKHETYSHPKSHAGMVERAIRTLKTKIYKYFTNKVTHKWINILPKVVESINNSVCRSTGYTPNSFNFNNAEERIKKLYKNNDDNNLSTALNKGDKVRVVKNRTTFKKGYLPSFSDEIFTIHQVLPTNPITYVIINHDNIIQNGKFYQPELCPVEQNDETIYRIIILKERKKKNIKEYFVSWVGYDDNHNSWIPETDLV